MYWFCPDTKYFVSPKLGDQIFLQLCSAYQQVTVSFQAKFVRQIASQIADCDLLFRQQHTVYNC